MEGLTPPLVSHSSTQQVGGGIRDKNWGSVSRRLIYFLSCDPVLLTVLVQPAQGGSGVLSSPRNDPQGDEGSQHPKEPRPGWTEGAHSETPSTK